MPSGTLAKRLLLLGGLGLLVLFIVGFVIGAIGSAMFGREAPFLKDPEIHLPPQPAFPASIRDQSLGLTAADDHNGEEAHFQPLGMTQFAITNTLLSAWLTSIVIILFFGLGARNKSLVPGRFQGLIESMFEAILNFSSSVLGPEMARRAFPVVATIFFFVLFNAWIALFLAPLYHGVGFGTGDFWNLELKAHLIRPAGTDLNMPLALALVSFAFVEYWGLRAHGAAYLKKFFAFGRLLRNPFQGLIDVFVGFLELISELVRIVSFTFRLFGNMTAGEILVVMITFLIPLVATQFVFGLELLIGLIQAVIFAGLTLVFLAVAVRHEEHH